MAEKETPCTPKRTATVDEAAASKTPDEGDTIQLLPAAKNENTLQPLVQKSEHPVAFMVHLLYLNISIFILTLGSLIQCIYYNNYIILCYVG